MTLRFGACVACVFWVSAAASQQLLDRVVAVVGGTAITETDVRAAIGLGIIEAPAGADALVAGTRSMIDRRLILQEVTRFQTAPPSDADVADEAARMRAHAGDRLPTLVQSTGVDEDRLRQLARDTLRIQAYVSQRFGTTAQASLQDAREYYEKHQAEFTRDGSLQPFEQVETAARTAASNERRRASIAQWITDLRTRGEVVEVKGP
jgi:hypothetical protein